MNWTKFEEQLRRRNPELFKAKKIQMTPDALLFQLRRAWDAGHEEAMETVDRVNRTKSLFGQVFGR
jgi:hypothetical protein